MPRVLVSYSWRFTGPARVVRGGAGTCTLQAQAFPAPGCCLSQALALLIEARAPGSGGRGACCAQAGMKCQTQRFRRHYAQITQKLRNHYAGITQRLRSHYAKITQTLRRHYAELRSHYADITQLLRNYITQYYAIHYAIHYAIPLRKSITQLNYANKLRRNPIFYTTA